MLVREKWANWIEGVPLLPFAVSAKVAVYPKSRQIGQRQLWTKTALFDSRQPLKIV
jgi:hypothetical protein